MNTTGKLAVAAASFLALTACGSSESGESGGRDAVAEAAEDVAWSNYAPDVRRRIDRLASNKSCGKLQAEFDAADGNGSADLMTYIDKQLEAAGCY